MECSAPRWQSREETHGAEQGTDGSDEPRVAAGRRSAANSAQPGAALAYAAHFLGLGAHVRLANAHHAR